jgi:hypothetical protein
VAITARSGTATVTTAASATTWTVNLPTYSANDYVVIWLANNIGSTAGTPTATGWTFTSVDESSGLKGTFGRKLMTGSEGTTVTVTWGAATLGVALATPFVGVDTTTPEDVAPSGVAEPSASVVAAHVTPSITTVTANAVLVSGFDTDNASTWTSTDTELGDSANTISGAMYYSAAQPIGSYTRTGTASITSVKAVSMIMALRPGAVAASTSPVRRAGRWRAPQ